MCGRCDLYANCPYSTIHARRLEELFAKFAQQSKFDRIIAMESMCVAFYDRVCRLVNVKE